MQNEEKAKELDKIFSGDINFIFGSYKPGDFPDANLPEIAFIGKSNVGKSSLINTLTSRKALARVSNTPGRTRQINFFQVRELFNLVDLPGYGYAKISASEQRKWENLILSYFNSRPSLRLVVVLVDSRRGINENDIAIFDLLEKYRISFWIVFTKVDKIKSLEKDKLLAIDILRSFDKQKIHFVSSFKKELSIDFKAAIYHFTNNGFILI